MTSGYLPSTVGAGELVAELAAVATATRTPCTASLTRSARKIPAPTSRSANRRRAGAAGIATSVSRNPIHALEWATFQKEAAISSASCGGRCSGTVTITKRVDRLY